MYSVSGQDTITTSHVRNWFSKFHLYDTSLRDEPRTGWCSRLGLQNTPTAPLQRDKTPTTSVP